ncbi:hypothetical protein I4U23_011269 [Adineta vaga]|nr:hypothetical protein I4U23_011269 [Adineta vaga]
MFWLMILFILGIICYIIYKKNKRKTSVDIPQYDHAIVIGGDFGGMITAVYLTKYFSKITIIESDDVLNDTFMKSTPEQILDYRCRLESPTSLGRAGVPHMYLPHTLTVEGHPILDELFPGLLKILFNEYNIRMYSVKNEGKIAINNILLNHNLIDNIEWLGIDRFTLEIVLRKYVYSKYEKKIHWICNSKVIQLLTDRSLNLVQRIKYRLKQNDFDIYGDFIIDCSGRYSSSIKWLKNDFNLNIPTEQIHFGYGALSFLAERLKTKDPLLDSLNILVHTANVPDNNIGCFLLPIPTMKTTDENSLGIITAIGINSNNFEHQPNKIPTEYFTILKSLKVTGPLISYSRDAMCTFDPHFGQGITHAFRQARELRNIFEENQYKLKDISHIYNSRASKISDECWIASTTSNWKTSTLKIIKTFQRDKRFSNSKEYQLQTPLLIKFIQWYSFWFLQCASKSGRLSTEFLYVINQYKNPILLFKPLTILAVCYTALMNYLGLSKKILT